MSFVNQKDIIRLEHKKRLLIQIKIMKIRDKEIELRTNFINQKNGTKTIDQKELELALDKCNYNKKLLFGELKKNMN